jgi:hypothetical protein
VKDENRQKQIMSQMISMGLKNLALSLDPDLFATLEEETNAAKASEAAPPAEATTEPPSP